MLTIILFAAGLGLAFGSGESDCETIYHGECHIIQTGCPSRFSHYTLNACGFLTQCCYNSLTSPSGHVTSGTGTTSSPSSGQGTCGTRDYTDNHRIVGGTRADPREYPWQVSLRYLSYHLCGGTLIDNQHILTAAHCFKYDEGPDYWSVGVGTNYIGELATANVRVVSKIVRHEHYDNITKANDIAIVKLYTPIHLDGPDVRAACLPTAGLNLTGRICTVTGWGHTRAGGNAQEYLREVDVPIIPVETCQFYLNSIGHGKITHKHICAGLPEEGGKDACQGDSGGPMVCQDEVTKQWNLVGVVSWGYGCGWKYMPGVYTRVSEYLDWINQHITA
ncbi:anionic trypsin-2-like [Babylonia areolata]|uniref:anionic trypsin-2-like n=1 Tax=Babylonia areolata TaxID=304850 RepID=UPI003FD465F0